MENIKRISTSFGTLSIQDKLPALYLFILFIYIFIRSQQFTLVRQCTVHILYYFKLHCLQLVSARIKPSSGRYN